MGSHYRFRLSHLVPNSWFYKLRDMKRPRPPSQPRSSTATRTPRRSSSSHYYCHGTSTPKPLPLPPHQSYSSYLQLRAKKMPPEKLRLSPLCLSPKATNIRFPNDRHQSPSSRSAAAVVVDDFQGLQLRPIRTRPAPIASRSAHHSTTASSTCPSSPRLRSRRIRLSSSGCCRVSTRCTGRRRSARRSIAVVVASTDPHKDFRESMVEMIVGTDMRGAEALRDLLDCYLSLNSREYHGVITEAFRGIWLQIIRDGVEI
ncbi:transcription repressor OFP1-like [Triticum dicoccoides]|uniref:transcription repressor OFP1-like n=1 Tax=Triticum dicoccoides TaxID=85692 RepID=UPI000E7AFDC6|nr:transcription repressor OFP1-like [Triticum dicoccoides]